jgi:ADP-ribose pyrophosphatase YjhB (NUDIX family)
MDLCFDHGPDRFHVRVGAVIVRSGHLLLQSHTGYDFFVMPGGQNKFGEAAGESVLREVREELGVTARLGRLLRVVENFYELDGRLCHAIEFYYQVHLPSDALQPTAPGTFCGSEVAHAPEIRFQWVPLAEVDRLPIYPRLAWSEVLADNAKLELEVVTSRPPDIRESIRDICFDRGDLRFNYRAGGVVLRDNHLLIEVDAIDDSVTIPGGRCRQGESSASAACREAGEELGVETEAVRPLWLLENFFTLDQKRYHELAIFYDMRVPEAALQPTTARSFRGPEAEIAPQFRYSWVPLADISRWLIQPPLPWNALPGLPDRLNHLVLR